VLGFALGFARPGDMSSSVISAPIPVVINNHVILPDAPFVSMLKLLSFTVSVPDPPRTKRSL
jgi:hypothetical protein